MKFSDAQDDMLLLLNESFSIKNTDIEKKIDYCSVFEQLKQHTILPITQSIYKKLPITVDLLKQWQSSIMSFIFSNTRIIKEEERICRLLENKDVKFAIIKGTASAQYYPATIGRCLGDIDILVLPVKITISQPLKSTKSWDKLGQFTKKRAFY